MKKPSLTFCCELDGEKLVRLFAGSKVTNYLSKLNANLSLGLLDFSRQRAEVVKKLNHTGIPVTAWILLPKEQGYWTSLDTLKETKQRYYEFKSWASDNNLNFAAVGLDIEPKLQTLAALSKNPVGQVLKFLKRYLSGSKYLKLEADFAALIQTIHEDGYPVETYQFPFMVDERIGRSNVLTKTLGLPLISADREVFMLYTSFFPGYRDSILWSYMQQCKSVGVGSTGGGVEIEGIPPLRTLRWIDLKRDLLLSAQKAENIYIFSLEGCLENHYMDRLVDLDWNTRIILPGRTALGITLIRKVGQSVLWALSHPLEMFFGLILGAVLIKKLRRLFSR